MATEMLPVDEQDQPCVCKRPCIRWDANMCSQCGGDLPSAVTSRTAAVEHAKALDREAKQPDPMVEHPPHYRAGTVYEAIRVIEAWGLGFHLGNAVKYICRADFKDNRLQNLQKARWYLNREIANMEAALAAEKEGKQ